MGAKFYMLEEPTEHVDECQIWVGVNKQGGHGLKGLRLIIRDGQVGPQAELFQSYKEWWFLKIWNAKAHIYHLVHKCMRQNVNLHNLNASETKII